MTHIIALTDDVHKGDNDNALAVQASLADSYKQEGYAIALNQYNIAEIDALTAHIKQNREEGHIIIGAGSQSVEPLLKLDGLPNVVTSWSGHQAATILMEGDAINKIDSIHLPRYAMPQQLRTQRNKVVETMHGVPNAKTAANFLTAFKQAHENGLKIPQAESYITVVLGGDAPDAGYERASPEEKKNHLHHFTVEEAWNLGKKVAWEAERENAVVLVTNGPRTGKYDAEGKPKTNPGTQDDPFLQAFEQGFQLNHPGTMAEPKLVKYDFHKGERAYDAIMGAAILKDGAVFLPGESTSMLTEAVECCNPGKVVAYKTNAMNETHERQSDILFNAGLIHKADADAIIHTPHITHRRPERAADTVAKHVANIARDKALESPAPEKAQVRGAA